MGITNQHIFILGSAKFDGDYESSIYTLARHMAKRNKVYYIDYPYTWSDCIRLRHTAQYKLRKPYFAFSSNGLMPTDHPGLKVVILPPLPSIHFLPEGLLYRELLKINEQLIVSRIKKIIAQENIRDFIYINSFNFHYPGVAAKLKPGLTVYNCVDPLIIPYDRKHGFVSEKKIVAESDLVICTSKQLYEEKKAQNPDTYFVPNAADLQFSGKALETDLEIHSSIAHLKKPVAGYFGNIERRMDFEVLKKVFEANPDISFVLAGPVSREFMPGWINNVPNLHLTGRIPYPEMPNVVKGFDVALIPFKKDEVSATIFPLKLFEYLGAGKPVVATNFNPDLKDYTEDTVAYCDNADEFSRAIRNALTDSEDKTAKRIAVAAKNTWEHRTQEIEDLLEKYVLRSA